MAEDTELAQTRPAALIAAALHLFSSTLAHGPSAAKTAALIRHLQTLATRADTDPLLARSCEELAAQWQMLASEAEAAEQPACWAESTPHAASRALH